MKITFAYADEHDELIVLPNNQKCDASCPACNRWVLYWGERVNWQRERDLAHASGVTLCWYDD